MKQVEACKLTDTVRDPSDQLSGRDDAASETQFPLFNLHWGGRGRIAAIGEAARDVCLRRKDFNRGRQPGLCASASLEFLVLRKNRKHTCRFEISRWRDEGQKDGDAAHRSIEK